MESQKGQKQADKPAVNKAGFFYSFIQKKAKLLHQKNQANRQLLRNKQAIRIQHQGQSQKMNKIELQIKQSDITEEQNKSNRDSQLIKNGKILRVIGQNLVLDQFRIQLEYQNEIHELIATKFQISQNNVRALLNWYENQLDLNEQ